MNRKFPRLMFGVNIVYVRDHIARKAVSVITGGRGVWMLLPNGKVGTNDANFFRWAYPSNSLMTLEIAEKLWRLGKMKETEYQKLKGAWDAKKKKEERKERAEALRDAAVRLGVALTKEQRKAIKDTGAVL